MSSSQFINLPHTHIPPPPPNTHPPPPNSTQSSGVQFTAPHSHGVQLHLVHKEQAFLDMDWAYKNVHDLDLDDLAKGDYARVAFAPKHLATVHSVSSRKLNKSTGPPLPLAADYALYTVSVMTTIPGFITQPELHSVPYEHIRRIETKGELEIGDYCRLNSNYDVLLKDTMMVKIKDIKRKNSRSIERMFNKSTKDARISEVTVSIVKPIPDVPMQYIVDRQLVHAELK